MKKKLFVHIIVCLLLVALFSVGCANVSHSSGKSEPTTPRIAATPRVTAEPTKVPASKKISIAESYANSHKDEIDKYAPKGVSYFSTVSFGSSSYDGSFGGGTVVIKGVAYGRDEYGRSAGRYTFEWYIDIWESIYGNVSAHSRYIYIRQD